VSAKEGQQHPIAIYFWIWGLLFVLSAFSYAVDYFHLQGRCAGR
jgi:cytochrome c oxidase subunit IV